ncbi:hypothetical protein ACFXPR_08145 [Nocardia tengchongensis]|uniref:hypothetical protein n=1 Tax=Nocardia tengchongensis TaxID=2055889 RepID=UPI0036BABCD6
MAKLGEQLVTEAPRRKLVHKLASARLEPRSYKPNRQLLPDEIRKLLARYEEGASIAELAREFGIHSQTVDAHLKQQGVESRSLLKMTPEQVEQAVKLYADGWSTSDLAKEFDVAALTIRMTLIRAERGEVEGVGTRRGTRRVGRRIGSQSIDLPGEI